MEDGCFSQEERDAVYRVIRARRDIRHFRPDPVPESVLKRILEAGHHAPSVGFMQPWNFIVISSIEMRQQIKNCFEKVNAGQVAQISDPKRRSLYSSLKLEGILESPLNLAVTCDHRRDAPFVLGREPVPETDVFSVCLAIENMWLAARAEGVGLGWVSILHYDSVSQLLDLPQGVELIAYLCVGYPLEFRPTPLLEEVGWKERAPLKSVIYKERWGGE
jgi:5,6-dimethylbenzimidazole synthase